MPQNIYKILKKSFLAIVDWGSILFTSLRISSVGWNDLRIKVSNKGNIYLSAMRSTYIQGVTQVNFVIRKLFPCAFTKVCVNRDRLSFIPLFACQAVSEKNFWERWTVELLHKMKSNLKSSLNWGYINSFRSIDAFRQLLRFASRIITQSPFESWLTSH